MKAAKLRFVSFLLLFLLLFSLGVSANDETEPVSPPPLDDAGQFALYNIENDRIIMQKGIDDKILPASTVKLMSGLIICEKLADRADEKVTLTPEMLRGGSGKPLGLAAGKTLSVRSLMLAAFSGGYSDAISVLANIGFGSSSKLVDIMNERAAVLGMSSTVYKNITGFDADGQVTTVRDSLRIAAAAAENEFFLEVSSEYNSKIEFDDGSSCLSYGSNELVNKNSIYYSRSVRGMNSGLTDGGGACLAALGQYDGARYIVLAMGCPPGESRFALAQNALDYVYNNYGYRTVLPAGTVVGETTVQLATTEVEQVKLVLSDDLRVFAGNHEELSDLEYSLIMSKAELVAPISREDTVAYYTAWLGKDQLSIAPVTVDRAVESNAFLMFMDGSKNYLTGRAFVATLVALAVLTLTALILPRIALISRQRNRKYVRQRGGFKLK